MAALAEAQEDAARRLIRHVEQYEQITKVIAAARLVSERLACMHEFDPECARCEWAAPLHRALQELEV